MHGLDKARTDVNELLKASLLTDATTPPAQDVSAPVQILGEVNILTSDTYRKE
jgi:hypothetical protein